LSLIPTGDLSFLFVIPAAIFGFLFVIPEGDLRLLFVCHPRRGSAVAVALAFASAMCPGFSPGTSHRHNIGLESLG
jgi:hypothetical protein